MTIYSDQLTFKEPTATEVELTSSLVEIIRGHNAKTREHLFHLCMIAYGLRKHNLMKRKSGAGGNASGMVMKPQFKAWYESNDLKEVYGNPDTNFILYAMSGRLLNYVRWQVGEEYITHLPKSLTALYKCSQILWKNGDSTDDTRRELFEDALKTPIRDGSKHNALITPFVSRKEIEDWLLKIKAELQPQATASLRQNDSPASSYTKDISIDLGSIRAHKDILKFSKTGRKLGSIDLPMIEQLAIEIKELVARFNSNANLIEFHSNLDGIRKTYESARQPDFGKNID